MTVACCQTVQMLAKTPRETQQREQQMSEATSDSCGWRPATRYPDPAIHALDPRFEKYWLKLSAVAMLGTVSGRSVRPVVMGLRRLTLLRHTRHPPHIQTACAYSHGPASLQAPTYPKPVLPSCVAPP